MTDPTKNATHTAAFKLEDLDDKSDYLRMILYGKPGTGKTTLAASAADVPGMEQVLLLDLEEGKMAIQNNERIQHRENITRVRITSYKQVAEVHKFLKSHCRLRDAGDIEKLRRLESKFTGVPVDQIKEPKLFRTVLIDTLTELNTFCLYELLGLSTEMDLTTAMSDSGAVEVAGFGEYKKNNQIMQLVARAYRDLPLNTIYICQQSFIQDEQKRFHYAPALTGQLSGQVQGFVDIVGYLKVGKLAEGSTKAPRRLYVQPVGNFDAKNRQASIDKSFFDDPVMLDLWTALES